MSGKWKCAKLISVAILCIFLYNNIQAATSYWDGEAMDGSWSSASNWSGNQLPTVGDTVVLDNSLLGQSYTVQLPSGNNPVAIAMLIIRPITGFSILLLIPSSSAAIPALSVTGIGGIVLNEGGVLRNNSGASSGTAISLSDSLYVLNGSKYIHNTDNGHASIISRLSIRSGTENGTVEFDVPGTASYSLSISNRIYGNLILNAAASGGARTYLSTGSNPLTIRGNFSLRNGVTLALNFSGDFIVLGKTVIQGIWNMSSGSFSNTIKLKGDVEVTGTVTESGTGQPNLDLSGNSRQQLQVTGAVINSITTSVNNAAGIALLSPFEVNFKIRLQLGKLMATGTNLLIIKPAAVLIADSSRTDVFVEGFLRKEGLSGSGYFLFPVGAGNTLRWITLRNATGSFTVSFHRQSAYSISQLVDDSLDHVSRIEYWSVTSSSVIGAQVELSFDNVNSGGVTDLSYLRTAQLQAGRWINTGVASYSGSAGASGSVTSSNLIFSGAGTDYFSLASSSNLVNPLPIQTVQLKVGYREGVTRWDWSVIAPDSASELQLLGSSDGITFKPLKTLPFESHGYISDREARAGNWFFMLEVHWKNGRKARSSVTGLEFPDGPILMKCQGTIVADFFQFSMSLQKPGNWSFYLMDMQGKLIRKYLFFIGTGTQEIRIPLTGLGRGPFQIFGVSSGLHTRPLRFLRI